MKIIALIPPKEDISLHKTLSDIEFLEQAKIYGKIITMSELCKLWNSDEIRVSDWFIRSLEVDFVI